MINIIYLYTSVTGYVLSTLKALHATGQVNDIHLIYRAKDRTDGNRFAVEGAPWLKLIPRHTLSDRGIFDLLRTVRPEIVYVSGWVDKGYLRAVSRYRAAGGKTHVVCGIDDQWKGSLRQYVGRIYFRLFYRRLFDYMWVSGKPQYHYAQRFGYGHENIICNLLSADTSVFDKKTELARRFVFVGRFAPVTGIDLLIEAYKALPEAVRAEWPLVLIGDGSLREQIEARASAQVIIKPYLQPAELRDELMRGGVACVPSYANQWGVVIHEMALLGYPMIVSSVCGAATEFLISGYNGFLFRSHDVASLQAALLKIASFTDAELEQFSEHSRELGLRITPEHAAASLLSVLPLAELAAHPKSET
jgi:glycosyltransferase involved in cell wall biosynthesis